MQIKKPFRNVILIEKISQIKEIQKIKKLMIFIFI